MREVHILEHILEHLLADFKQIEDAPIMQQISIPEVEGESRSRKGISQITDVYLENSTEVEYSTGGLILNCRCS